MKHLIKNTLISAMAVVSISATASATVTTWTHETSQISHPTAATDFRMTWSTNNQFTMDMTFEYDTMADRRADGGWFVVTPGWHPTTAQNDAAFFWADFDTGHVYAYNYAEGGYENTDNYITTYRNVITMVDDGLARTMSMSFDATEVQEFSDSDDWTGVEFGTTHLTSGGAHRYDQAGLWLHLFDNFSVEEDSEGRMTSRYWEQVQDGYELDYGATTRTTTSVSEPAGLALLGLIGLALMRRRVQK